MSKLFNRAKMTTATTGTGNLTLGSAASGFVTFATAGVVNGDVVRYCIEAENGTDFEIGEGTYTASGTVLSRADADVQLSSNSNNRITLATGTHNVFITAADSDFTQEIIVTVANAGAGNKYVIDGTSQQIITLLPSITYRLDQSDSTNAGHPLVLASGSADGSTYSTGVRTVGTPGSKGSYTEVKLEQDAPALWFKCSNHAGMGNSINLAAPASGGVTSYSNLAGFPSSGNTHGDMGYAQDTKVSYMWLDSSWQRMAIGPQVGPILTTTPATSLTLDGSSGATGSVTMAAIDESGFPITYDWDALQGTTVYNAASLPTALTSVAQSNGVFTLTPSANSSHATTSLKFRSKASDGVLFTPAITTISLEFTQDLEVASGGGVATTYSSGGTTYRVLRFTSGGVLTVNSTTSVDYLIVGGGGSGGNDYGGGGGAGGLVYQASQSLSAGNYDVVVGAGGAAISLATNANPANNGTNSTFNGLVAIGGGGGGSEGIQSQRGYDGGSGGASGYGGSSVPGASTQNAYSGTGYGNAGGTGSNSPNYNPGGGGGAGSVGSNGSSTVSGNGGAGKAYDITGTSLFYAAGGGGGWTENGNGQAGAGGSSIGGNGAVDNASNGSDAAANTGSGGGGASGNQDNRLSGAGSTGVVIIRYVVT